MVEATCTYLGLTVGSQQGAASDPGASPAQSRALALCATSPPTSSSSPRAHLHRADRPGRGQVHEARATVTPAEANAKCFFASGNTDVATVDSDGNVTGVAAGEAVITVRCASKPSICTQVKVTVAAK